MKKEFSKQSKQELTDATRQRYLSATRDEKSKILDHYVELTSYHRKHAIRVLTASPQDASAERPCARRIYDEAVTEALIVIWEAADRICGKRLKAILPTFIESMEHNGYLELDAEVKARLLEICASTIDRLLAPIRKQAKGRRKKRNAPRSASKQIPVKTFSEWDDALPGELEIDFVVHCGPRNEGSCISSLAGSDVCSGWTEAVALPAREQSLVAQGLDIIDDRFPVPVIGLNPDNDSAFINDTVIAYCDDKDIRLTRSRPYKKNDQAWIEQKNGTVIRRFVGYDRFNGTVSAQLLGQLYFALGLYVNYFQPSFKLLEKTREGAKVKKRYSRPMTPADRLLNHPMVSDEEKEAIRAKRAQLDPIKLLHEIRELQAALAAIASPDFPERPGKDLDEFFSQLSHLWQEGEVRLTHRKRSDTHRHWRTRKDPFEDVWPEILYWLLEEPDATAKSLFQRLMDKYPGKFEYGQLRTLQRRVKEWRHVMVQELVQNCSELRVEMAQTCR